jgi:hypothetical protein
MKTHASKHTVDNTVCTDGMKPASLIIYTICGEPLTAWSRADCCLPKICLMLSILHSLLRLENSAKTCKLRIKLRTSDTSDPRDAEQPQNNCIRKMGPECHLLLF